MTKNHCSVTKRNIPGYALPVVFKRRSLLTAKFFACAKRTVTNNVLDLCVYSNVLLSRLYY